MTGFGSYDGDDTVVKGDDGTTTGVKITATTDGSKKRLDVSTSMSPVPASRVMYRYVPLLNASSPLMTVNGTSGAPVNFSFTPAASETWYLERLIIMLVDPGDNIPTTYGALAALTNGTRILVRSNGTEYEIANLQNNAQLYMCFAEDGNKIVENGGLFDDVDSYQGALSFKVPIAIANSTSDYIRAAVRDNLTGLQYHSVGAVIWRTI